MTCRPEMLEVGTGVGVISPEAPPMMLQAERLSTNPMKTVHIFTTEMLCIPSSEAVILQFTANAIISQLNIAWLIIKSKTCL
jgi:hypothetical protein